MTSNPEALSAAYLQLMSLMKDLSSAFAGRRPHLQVAESLNGQFMSAATYSLSFSLSPDFVITLKLRPMDS